MECSVLLQMQKVNILVLRINKLSMKNFVEFLNGSKKIVLQMEKNKLCDVPKWDVTSSKKENRKEKYLL